MTVLYFAGYETGDTSEMPLIGAGSSVRSDIVRSGAYSFQMGTGTTGFTGTGGVASTQVAMRAYLYIETQGGGSAILWYYDKVTGSPNLQLQLLSSGLLQLLSNTDYGHSTTTGTTVLSTGRWYRVEFICDQAAGGVLRVLLDGVPEIDITHPTDASAATISRIRGGVGASGSVVLFDDVRIDKDTTTPIGSGRVIARQPKTGGTPTYDQFTKSSGTDAGALWDNTPFDTTDFCSDSTSGHAQTAVIAVFSATQTGHGTTIVGTYDTVNACKAAFVGKRATSGSPKIRRRIGGVDTDTAKAMTASDAYYDDGIWTTTVANLDTAEVGCVKAADANLTTIEDVWLMADISPAFLGGFNQYYSRHIGRIGQAGGAN